MGQPWNQSFQRRCRHQLGRQWNTASPKSGQDIARRLQIQPTAYLNDGTRPAHIPDPSSAVSHHCDDRGRVNSETMSRRPLVELFPVSHVLPDRSEAACFESQLLKAICLSRCQTYPGPGRLTDLFELQAPSPPLQVVGVLDGWDDFRRASTPPFLPDLQRHGDLVHNLEGAACHRSVAAPPNHTQDQWLSLLVPAWLNETPCLPAG